MMLGFASNPPGAIPPPTISPANPSEKYDRPKEAHSSSNNSLQQVINLLLFFEILQHKKVALSKILIQIILNLKNLEILIGTVASLWCYNGNKAFQFKQHS